MPTPNIDIGELRRLEKAATADASLGNLFTMTNAEWDYWTALRNAAPALWEECERLKDECHELQEMVSAEQERANERGNEIAALKSRLAAADAVVSAARTLCTESRWIAGLPDTDRCKGLGNRLVDALSTYEGKS